MQRTLVSVLADAFQRYADRPAVYSGDLTASYGEVWRKASSIAGLLRSHGIGPGDRVGIWMDKSLETVEILLGTLLAGAAYVPIDPRAPNRRVGYIIQNCSLSALAIDAMRSSNMQELADVIRPLRLLLGNWKQLSGVAGPMACPLTEPDSPSADFRLPETESEQPAYILYTSGSTGRPKGVVLSHRAALGFIDWCLRTFHPVPEDRMSSHAPFHFDLSTFDLFVTFASGASVRLLNSAEAMAVSWLTRKVDEWGITVWYSVPSALISMLEHGSLEERPWLRVRLVLFAGEVFPVPFLTRLRQALPQARLVNLYGPTETNVCTWYEVREIGDRQIASIPIGQVCSHLSMAIFDEEKKEVGHGVEGDLWIGGDNLLSCYWGDSELTQLRLIKDPRPGHSGLLYNTGDRVRLDTDGNLIYLGRIDHMVKVRGYRIELGEVENAFYIHPAVEGAAAVAVPDDHQGSRIEVHVALKPGTHISGAHLQTHLRSYIPLYMIPSKIHFLAKLPLTSTGKVDREALRLRSFAGTTVDEA